MHISTSVAGIKRMVSDSLQWCAVTGQGAMARNKKKKLHLNMKKNFLTLKVAEQWNSFPGRLWSLPLWRHSKSTWTPSSVTCSK